MENPAILKQKIKRTVLNQNIVHGYVVATSRTNFAFSYVDRKIDWRIVRNFNLVRTNPYDDKLAFKIAKGRADKSRKPLTLERFKKRNSKWMAEGFAEFCENELIKQMFEEGKHRTVTSVILEYVKSQNRDLNFQNTHAETIYPYLIVMKNRMERYYKE